MSADGEIPADLGASLLADRHGLLRQEMASAGGDEYRALRAVLFYLKETGIPQAQTAPLMRRMLALEDEKSRAERKRDSRSGAPRALDATFSLAICAATVTALKDRKVVSSVEDAEMTVATAAGINAKEIHSFRYNTSRSREATEAKKRYDQYVCALRGMTDEQFEAEAMPILRNLRRFRSIPPEFD